MAIRKYVTYGVLNRGWSSRMGSMVLTPLELQEISGGVDWEANHVHDSRELL